MNEIKNVIFDLGGVLVDLDIERCTAAFRALGMPRVADLINPYYPAEMIGRLERGDISFREACDEMRRLDGRPEVTDSEIAAAYSAFLVGIPVAKLRQIMRLREAGVPPMCFRTTTRRRWSPSAARLRPTGIRWTTISTRYTFRTNCTS